MITSWRCSRIRDWIGCAQNCRCCASRDKGASWSALVTTAARRPGDLPKPRQPIGRQPLVRYAIEDLPGYQPVDRRREGNARMRDGDAEPLAAFRLVDYRKTVDQCWAVADREEIKFEVAAFAQRLLHLGKQRCGRRLRIFAGIAAAEIGAGNDAPLRGLTHVGFRSDHQAVQAFAAGASVDDEPWRRLERDAHARRSGERNHAGARGKHDMIGVQLTLGGDDALDPAIALDQARHPGIHQEPGAMLVCIRERDMDRRHGFDGPLFGDRKREARSMGQLRLQPANLRAIDAPDAVAPAAVLPRIGFELVGRKIPLDTAAPPERETGQFTGKSVPLVHRVPAETKIELGIAPAGVDPAEGGGRRDTAGHLGDHRHRCAPPREMPGYRSTDDASPDDDHMLLQGQGLTPSKSMRFDTTSEP
jgi:hypothetical protein